MGFELINDVVNSTTASVTSTLSSKVTSSIVSTTTEVKDDSGPGQTFYIILAAVIIIVPICVTVIFFALLKWYQKRRLTKFKTARPKEDDGDTTNEDSLLSDTPHRIEECLRGSSIQWRNKTLTVMEQDNFLYKVSGVARVSMSGSSIDFEKQYVMAFEIDSAPQKRIRAVHQLVHRLNQQGDFFLGTLACSNVLSPPESNVTHECLQGKVRESGQSINFVLYEHNGLSLATFMKYDTKEYAVEVATKMLQGLYALHTEKYAHGKLTPSCFYVDPRTFHVIMADFGFLHKQSEKKSYEQYYLNEDVHFNPIYQSVSSHMVSAPNFLSDLETWTFIFIEFIVGNELPWAQFTDKGLIQDTKLAFIRCADPFRRYTKDLRPDVVKILRDIYWILGSPLDSELNSCLAMRYQNILDKLSELDCIVNQTHQKTVTTAEPIGPSYMAPVMTPNGHSTSLLTPVGNSVTPITPLTYATPVKSSSQSFLGSVFQQPSTTNATTTVSNYSADTVSYK